MFRSGFGTSRVESARAQARGSGGWGTVCQILPVVVVLGLALPACSGHRKPHKHPAFVTELDAAGYLCQALEAENPDRRREAIVRLSKTRHVNRDTVLRGFALIAETDPSSSVRCAAIRGLGKSCSPQAIEPLLRVLAADGERDPGVVAPEALVRWDAVTVSVDLIKVGVDVGEHRDAVRTAAVRLLETDPSRDVRISAAELLGFFSDAGALDALIGGLKQRDFGVVCECERSLMRITGRTHDHDPVAWADWLHRTDDPFADVGRLDGQLSREQPNWFRRSWKSTRRALASFKPKDG